MKTQFSNGTIVLRPLRASDAEPLHEAVLESARELTRWMRWFKGDFSMRASQGWIRQVHRWWRLGEAFNFGIFDRRGDRFLGSIWLSQINPKHQYANVGYWVRTSATGSGIATAAVKLILQFGFEEAGMNRLEILAAVGNKASRAVARKIGARPEGVLRHRLLLQNRFHNAVMFSVLEKDRKPSGKRLGNVSVHRKNRGASSLIRRLNSER